MTEFLKLRVGWCGDVEVFSGSYATWVSFKGVHFRQVEDDLPLLPVFFFLDLLFHPLFFTYSVRDLLLQTLNS